MSNSIEIIGSSTNSYEEATRNAVLNAKEHFHDHTIHSLVQLKIRIRNCQVELYQAVLEVSQPIIIR